MTHHINKNNRPRHQQCSDCGHTRHIDRRARHVTWCPTVDVQYYSDQIYQDPSEHTHNYIDYLKHDDFANSPVLSRPPFPVQLMPATTRQDDHARSGHCAALGDAMCSARVSAWGWHPHNP
eukprot:5042691-Alexandrium_andersonii.AAC.1